MKTVPQLPQDIIVNILSRLPIKKLKQLKCVNKTWRSLITDPQLAKLHLAQSKKNNIFSSQRILLITIPLESVASELASGDDDFVDPDPIHLDYPLIMKKIPESDELIDDYLEIGGSCNGLVFVVFENGRIFLWNPTIREALELATDHNAFDPKGTFVYGLGYDFSNDEYKVVRASHSSTTANAFNKTAEVAILSLKSNIWRRIEDRNAEFLLHGGAGIFLNGALHWLATRANDPKKRLVIVSFDMTEEKFYELARIPDEIEESKHHLLVLTISGADCLCLFYGGGSYETDLLEAWLLKEYGVMSSWIRLFSVYRDIISEHEYWENALYYTRSDKVVLDYDGRDLVWYDHKENTLKSFSPQNDKDWFRPVVYVESMVSPIGYCSINIA